MAKEPDGEQWKPLDEGILRREMPTTLKTIRETCGVGLKEAIDMYHERYRMLRESRPAEFICDDETYWEGVYS
jgi:hypothetical protein